MAMHAGLGFSKILIIAGAGYTGTILIRNGKLSDVLSELQALLKSGEKSGDDTIISDSLASQVHRLAMEVRQLASARPVTVLNGSSGQGNVTDLILPAASLGLLGYGYMWWKGISFSDFMYVTKRNMASAVSGMTKHLNQVSEALAKTKKYLTERIQNLDDKMDDQKVILSEIKCQVVDTHSKLEDIGGEVENLKDLVYSAKEHVASIGNKQEFTCNGLWYLLKFIRDLGAKVPDDILSGFPEMPGRSSSFLDNAPGGAKALLHSMAGSANPDGCNNDVISANNVLLKNFAYPGLPRHGLASLSRLKGSHDTVWPRSIALTAAMNECNR